VGSSGFAALQNARSRLSSSFLMLAVYPIVLTALIMYFNNNLFTASGLSPGGSGYFTFKLRQTY
jgi:hypothetical protein